MNGSQLETAIQNAAKTFEALHDATDAEFPGRAKIAQDAANELNSAFVALDALYEIPARHYFALQQANGQVIAALKTSGTYAAPEIAVAKLALERFQTVARQFTEIVAASYGARRAEPLLSESGRFWVGITAALMLVLGASFAALGVGMSWPAATTLSYWCSFAAFALAAVWVFAYFTLHRPSVIIGEGTKAGANVPYFVFGGMAFLVLGLLAAGVLTGGLLQFLSSTTGARGLITFLIAIGTIAIAVILTLASVVMEARNVEFLKERLSKGKEILTVLVGVLGTIVGFYFASDPQASAPGKMTVAIVDSEKDVVAGAEFSVLAMTTGGVMPYDSTPIITGAKGIQGEGTVSEAGLIKATFKVAPDVKPGAYPFVVGLRDKLGGSATVKSEVNVGAK